MSNSIFEDALFLAAGGIVGLIAGAALMSDDEEEEEEEARVAPRAVGPSIEELLASLKGEAQQALVDCETDEERENVSARIRKSIEGLQAVLAKHTAKAAEAEAEASDRFVALGKDGQPQPNESFAPEPAKRFQQLAAKLEQALDETLADLPPVTSRPSAPAPCGDS